ncbi:putative integral membrane protein [Rosellinia necatrix]|uniref:Putative integral membrane protein n=1 Tax=Rosellinia necatrix TaxID=77044 RepID=A0A1W2TP46_ROSNE|nr:putative integral membrane protein [Rosellinia necatrix]
MASSLGIWHGSWGYIGATIFLAIVSTLAVALRFWSRRISGLGIHTDDWLALVTLLVHHGLGATIIIAFVVDGLGFDTPTLILNDPAAAMELQKLTFIGTILYGVGSTSIRLSVIIFYFRIFPTKIVRRGGYIIATICLLWFVAIEGLNLATCTPIAKMWDWSITEGKCISAPAGVIVPGAFNVVIDAVTVALPIHEVQKLHLSREKKLVIFGVFLIGGIATGASLARLISISLYLNIEGSNGTGSTSALLSATTGFEIYIAIIGACAPTLVPVYKRLRGPRAAGDEPIPHRSGYTTKPPKKQSPSSHTYVLGATNPALSRTALRESDDEERPFKRLDDVHVLVPPKERGEFWTDISARPASEGIPLGGIRVQRDVTWNSED